MAWGVRHARLPPLMKQITIVGGGLAGLSLAVALRQRQVPVTVLEAGHYPRHRVCGEFLSGVSIGTLEYLGIRDLLDDAKRHRTIRWCEGGRMMHCETLPEAAWGISRFVFDDRLKRRVESLGGEVRIQVRAQPEPEEGLVWAAGRKPCAGPWIGLKAHVRGLTMSADLEMHTGHNGYTGITGVEDDWLNVCGLFRVDHTLQAKGSDILPAYLEAGGNPQLAESLRQASWREGSFSAIAGFALGYQSPVPGLLRLGDAESVIPPFTGNGMTMALQAAESACGPMVAWAAGHLTWQAAVHTVKSDLTRRFKRRLAVARFLHRFLFDDTGRSLLHSLSSAHLLPFRPIHALVR